MILDFGFWIKSIKSIHDQNLKLLCERIVASLGFGLQITQWQVNPKSKIQNF
jgi:hypothetical protein